MQSAVRLVLVHGTQLSAAQWHGYAVGLGPDVEVITPDLPAHGARIDEVFTWDGALAVIDEAVGPVTDDRLVLLGGHSLGGYLAMAWAARHPTSLAGLVAMGTCAIPRGPGATAYRLLAKAGQRIGPARMGSLLDRQLGRMVPDPEHVAAMHDAGYGLMGVEAAWEAVMTEVRPNLLADVSCPIWLVNGQFDQLRVHVRAFEEAARSSPHVEVVTIPRALHIFPMTHRAEMVAVLDGVLAAVKSRT